MYLVRCRNTKGTFCLRIVNNFLATGSIGTNYSLNFGHSVNKNRKNWLDNSGTNSLLNYENSKIISNFVYSLTE